MKAPACARAPAPARVRVRGLVLAAVALVLAGILPGCPRDAANDGDPAFPAAVASAVEPGQGSRHVFDEDAPPRTFRVEVAPQDWEWLNAHATEETYVPARVVFEGEAYENASIRFKGSYGSLFSCFDDAGNRTCPKLSMKVSFNETDPQGRFLGLRKLVFNSCNRDPSCLRERTAYALFRAAGLPASRAVHVLLQVNDAPAGLFLLVENPDKEFLQDHFRDPGGNLYKEAWPWSLEAAGYAKALQTNEDAPDVSRLLQFAALLHDLPEGGFNEAVDPWIDRDAMARYLAVDLFLHDWDGITRLYCGPNATTRDDCGNHNFLLYDDPATGRFTVIPWDQDHSLEAPDTDLGRSWWDDGPDACKVAASGWVGILPARCDPLLRGLLRDNWNAYLDYQRAWSQDDGILSRASVQARLDRYRAQVLQAVAEDPDGPTMPDWRRATARLREILAAQAVEVGRLLEWSGPAAGRGER